MTGFPKGLEQVESRSVNRPQILQMFIIGVGRAMPPELAKRTTWKSLRLGNTGGKDTATFQDTDTWGQLEDRLGMHPLQIPSWCSYFRNLKSEVLEALKSDQQSTRIQRVAAAHAAGHGRLPAPMVLVTNSKRKAAS